MVLPMDTATSPFPVITADDLTAAGLTIDGAETFEANCPDCGGRLYWSLRDGHFDCGKGCDLSPLVPRDVYLEWNERPTTLTDTRGRLYLAHTLYPTAPEIDPVVVDMVVARIRDTFPNLTEFMTDPGGFLAYYGDTFGDVDDDHAAAAITVIGRIVDAAAPHHFDHPDESIPEACRCGAMFATGFHLEAVKRAHLAHFA